MYVQALPLTLSSTINLIGSQLLIVGFAKCLLYCCTKNQKFLLQQSGFESCKEWIIVGYSGKVTMYVVAPHSTMRRSVWAEERKNYGTLLYYLVTWLKTVKEFWLFQFSEILQCNFTMEQFEPTKKTNPPTSKSGHGCYRYFERNAS